MFCEDRKNIERAEEKNNMTYTEAVKLAKQGNEEGFQFLYESTYKKKMYIAIKYMKNEDAAMDVLQDAYIKAFSKLDTLEDPEKFPGWMGMIVANTAKNALEKKNPLLFSQMEQENEEGETFEYQMEDEDTWNQPELAYTQQETQELVRELIGSLSEDQKLCVMMFHIEGLSIKEIAEAMDCSENTVKSRLNYGRKNIKEKAEELQKKGVKLYSSAPLALLVYLLQKEAGAFTLSELAQTTATYAHFAVKGGAALTGNSQTAGVMQGTEQVTRTVESLSEGIGHTMKSTTDVTGTIAKEAGKEVSKTFLQTVAGKVTVGLAVTAILGTGIFFGTKLTDSKEEATTEYATQTVAAVTEEQVTEAVTEEATTQVQLTEEELYYAFLEEEWIPEHGIGITSESGIIERSENNGLLEREWLHAAGALAADIYDYDGDGVKDMLLIHNLEEDNAGRIEYTIMFDMYTLENEQVILKASNENREMDEYIGPDGMFAIETSNMIAKLNRVVVDGVTYLTYTIFSRGGLDYDGGADRYYVMQYADGEWDFIAKAHAEPPFYASYTRFVDGQAIQEGPFTSGDVHEINKRFEELGIIGMAIGMVSDVDGVEAYNVKNENAVPIFMININGEWQDEHTAVMTYTVTDGTGLREKISQE
ncbi:MAG: RNA polymerase sigma factor [Lachnospiraceae bacterium]|nr:RNA polymerase sigma factor [Lachnospiraceae bacterium]